MVSYGTMPMNFSGMCMCFDGRVGMSRRVQRRSDFGERDNLRVASHL